MRQFSVSHSVLLLLPIAVCLCNGAFAQDYRTWTDATGKQRVDAQFLDARDGKVRIRRKDNGAIVTVPLERLSETDHKFIRNELLPKWISIPKEDLSFKMTVDATVGTGRSAGVTYSFSVSGNVTRRSDRKYEATGSSNIVPWFRAPTFSKNHVSYALEVNGLQNGPIGNTNTLDGSISFGLRGKGEQFARLHPEVELYFAKIDGDPGDVIRITELDVVACASNVLSFQDGAEDHKFVIVNYAYEMTKGKTTGGLIENRLYSPRQTVFWPYETEFLKHVAAEKRQGDALVECASKLLEGM